MIYDILEVFKKEYEKSGDELILGSYSLKDGLYVIINKDKTLSFFEAKTVKQEKLFANIDGKQDSRAFEKLKVWDYYSSYLNSNKALFDKKVHNINYLSYFFKAENSEYVKDKIDEHFAILSDFSKFKTKQDKEILEKYQEVFKDELRKEDILQKQNTLKENFDEIIELSKQKEIKNYIKIFFEEDLKIYQKESEIYLALKIFNDSKYNEIVDDKIYGLSNANMGLNSKKPYLENKTKKLNVPFLIENSDALMLKKFFDWLKIQPYRDENKKAIDRYLDEHFYIQKQSKNDEAEISDFDYIPLKSDDAKKHFKIIQVKNYLRIRNKNTYLLEDYKINELWSLEEKVDELFYNRQLKNNYYGEVYKQLDKDFSLLIYMTRDSMINYFKKNNENSFYQAINKYGSRFIELHIKKGRFLQASLTLNLKLSLLSKEYKGKKIMNIKSMQENMQEKLLESSYSQLEKDEFFYLCGQVIRYLLNQSEKHDKKHDMLEPFLRANSIKKLKADIKSGFFKYKHKIPLNFTKFNNALALIYSYEIEDKVSKNKDFLMIGILSDNIFYMKKED